MRLTAGLVLLVSLAPTARAHHSAAMFDATRTVTIEGTVERYDWANPHVYLHVASSSGIWLIEAGSPSMMQRAGWSRESFSAGDVVSVDANPARTGRMARGITVRAGGTVLAFRGQAPDEPGAAVPATGLGGNWLPSSEPVFQPFVAAPTAWSLTPKAVEALGRYDVANNPGVDCVALQAPFQMVWTDLKNIEVNETTVVLRSALNVGVERLVHLDQTTHDGAPFTNDGHSIGRFDNGVLVVDTRNFSDHPAGNRDGVPSGAQKHLVERFELSPDRTTLAYRFRLEDPEYLAAPFEGSATWAHRPDLTYTAEKCDPENARRFLGGL